MSEITPEQRKQQLQLLVALDQARDTFDDDIDPMTTFQSILELLQQQFRADACGLLLTGDTTGDGDIVATINVTREDARLLCQEAMALAKPGSLSTTLWAYTLALRIKIDHEEGVPGGFFLARRESAFTADEITLLELAETQIDSAVMQARTIWKLAERNRRLEAINRIDRLRDESPDEVTLLSDCNAMLAKQFKADLCLIIVSHIDTGEMSTQGLIDRRNLSTDDLKQIMESSQALKDVSVLEPPAGIEALNLLASPLVVSGVRFGALVVGRERPFGEVDHRLLEAIAHQMDSAIARSRTDQQLAQRTRELEAIYRIDHIRDRDIDFDAMMQLVLTELCSAVNSETGYLMLYNDDHESPLEVRAATRENLLMQPDYYETIKQVSRIALDRGEVVHQEHVTDSVRSIIAVPLILNARIIGVFGAINSVQSYGFSAEDRRMLEAITSQVDTAVFERLERRRMRKVLSRSVDPKVLEALLQKADDSLLAGERVVLSVLFADLRGSTEWAERTDPEDLVQMLNTFLGVMTDVIFKHGGTLDKFVGDEVIALFGSPVSMDHHAYHAAQAALEMQMVHGRMMAEFESRGREIPTMGIGISSGEVIAGEFGPPIRTDYTAMGRVMNLGARLCSAAPGGEIIISDMTRELLADRVTVETLDPIKPKGINRFVPVYRLVEMT